MKVKYICEQCGKEFMVSPFRIKQGVKFCSLKCRGDAHRGSKNPSWKGGEVKRICRQCGIIFYVPPGRAKKGEGTFCSRKCYALSKPQKVEKICEVCGKSFMVWHAYAAKGAGRFCSRECYLRVHKLKWEKRICKQCGGTFLALSSEVRRGHAHFCSKSCAGKAQTFSKVRKERMDEARKHRIYPTHHTKPELIFKDISLRNDLPFRFVGNGEFHIGNLIPDFIHTNKKKKICVEVLGAWWHNSMLNQKIPYERTYNGREALLKSYGWKMIGIWDHDLLRSDAETFVLYTLKKHKIYPSIIGEE